MHDLSTLQVGVAVTTDRSGRVTRHVIVARCASPLFHGCQSGVMLRLDPQVPGTASTNSWVCASRFEAVA